MGKVRKVLYLRERESERERERKRMLTKIIRYVFHLESFIRGFGEGTLSQWTLKLL